MLYDEGREIYGIAPSCHLCFRDDSSHLRIQDVVLPKGGPDKYLESRYRTKDSAWLPFCSHKLI